MTIQIAKDKNIINVKMPSAAKVWASLSYLLLCVFIWLFFSPSVDAFIISSPIADKHLGKPIIYQDIDSGIQVASLLTEKDSGYQYVFVFLSAEEIGESWIRFAFDDDNEGNPVALETELSLSGIVTIVANEEPIKMFRYPLRSGDGWEQKIDDVDFAFGEFFFEGQTFNFVTTVRAEEIRVPAGSFETLHVATLAEADIFGFRASFHQDTWLDERGFPIQRLFRVQVLGMSLEVPIKLLLPIPDQPQLAIVPDHVDSAGGTQIIIVGDGFTKETRVKIGTKDILNQDVEFNEDTKLLTTWTPSGKGTVQVITNTDD